MADYQLPQYESVRKPQKTEVPAPEKMPRVASHPLVSLQGRAGNQAVARMVQRAAEEDELQMKHDSTLQREEEAEAEDEELRMKHDASLQREEEAEAEDEELRMKHDPTPRVGLEGGPVGGEIEGQINSMRGQGSSVPDGIRAQMEAATGADLSGVKVHQDKASDTLNRQMTAKAFTTGNDIFLRSDASPADSRLMGHELAHVVQQSTGRTVATGGMAAGAANDPLEHEADQLADAVLSGSAQRHAEEFAG